MGIIIKNTLVERHYFINMAEHYHRLLCHVYFIIITEILGIQLNLVL